MCINADMVNILDFIKRFTLAISCLQRYAVDIPPAIEDILREKIKSLPPEYRSRERRLFTNRRVSRSILFERNDDYWAGMLYRSSRLHPGWCFYG